MIVLDTHAWLWWISSPENLSSEARKAVDQAASENGIYISAMSSWEIAMLAEKGRLKLSMTGEDWIHGTESLPFVNFVPVDNRIALRSIKLTDFPSPDPVDRIIIATGLVLGMSVVTKDRKIRSYPGVKSIW